MSWDFGGCSWRTIDGSDDRSCDDGGRSGFALRDRSGEAFASADAFEEEFGDVFDGDGFGAGFAGGAAEHALAEGAADGEDFFAGCRGQCC